MNKTTIANPIPQQDEAYQSALDATLLEIQHNRRDIAEAQMRIERLRAETSEMLEETKEVLSKLAA